MEILQSCYGHILYHTNGTMSKMISVCVVFLLLVVKPARSEVNIEENAFTVGVIADGYGPEACFSVTKFGYNITAVWVFVDTTEPFKVFNAVRRFESRGAIDVVMLFDYDYRLLQNPHTLSPGHQRLIALDKRHGPNELNEQEQVNSDDFICGGKVPARGQIEDPYCETELNGSSDTIVSAEVAASIGSRALTELVVEKLQWRQVVILHENKTDEETKDLADSLSWKGVMFSMYNVDTTVDFNATVAHIYHSTIRVKPEMNFVVVCRQQCVKKILHIVNQFDYQKNIHTTLLKQFSRWLVAVHGHTKDVSRFVHACADDLDNVVILAIPDVNGPSPRDLTAILDSVVTDMYSNGLSNETLTNVTKSEMIEKLEKKAKSWNPSSRCQGYKIDTLLWTKNGRDLSTVGHVDVQGHIKLRSELFPNTRYGYNKRKFVVSTLEYDPFVIKRSEKVIDESTGKPTGNETVHYEGFTMDLLHELAIVLNFTYVLIEPADQKWGGLEIKENLTFNGLIGQLQREDCDLVAAPISIQPNREIVVDFSYPFFYEYTTVVVKKPDPQAMKWRTLIDPFKWEVLVSIGIALAVVTVLIFLLEKYNPFYANPKHGEDRSRNGGLHYLHNSFWYMYGCLLNQGGLHLPDSTAGRTFVSCWWLMCIVVVGIYSGNLIAFLTVTKEKPPFNTLAEMVEMKGYKWGTLGATNWETLFLTSNLPLFKKIGDGFREFNESDPGVLNTGLRYHLDRVKQGGYAWIGDKTAIEIAMANECDLIKIKDEFVPMKYAFGFPENSPHNVMFSEQIMKLHESGLFQIWKRKWWPKSNFCALSKAPEATPISLIDVQSAFYVCVLGAIVGVAAFTMEHIVYRLNVCKRRKSGENAVKCITTSVNNNKDT